MYLQNLLKKNNIEFKIIDEDKNLELLKIGGTVHILYIERNDNQFCLDRDFFEYIDNNKIPYLIVLKNIHKNQMFLLTLKNGNNWVKACFDSCMKDSLFLGKQVMNYRTNDDEVIELIKKRFL